MLAYCIIINTPSKHSKSRNWAIALAALARFNTTVCIQTYTGGGSIDKKYVLYYYDRYTYSSSIDSTTVSIRRGLIYYTYT